MLYLDKYSHQFIGMNALPAINNLFIIKNLTKVNSFFNWLKSICKINDFNCYFNQLNTVLRSLYNLF
jgi:hypothetical protein